MKKLKSGITQMRKYLWSMTILVMLFVVVLSPMQAKASSEELTPEVLWERLEALKVQFPDGRYWNHRGSDENNPEGTTDQICGGHVYDNYVIVDGRKTTQCWGFANLISEKLYGTYFQHWSKTKNTEEIRPGDVLQYGYSASTTGHTVLVLGIGGDDVCVVDCNADKQCGIRWYGIISRKEINADMNTGKYASYSTNGVYRAPMVLPLEEGYCGRDATYELLSDGTLTIHGTGALYDRFFENNLEIKNLIIQDGITVVGLKTFANCTNLESVQLPDSVRTIYAKSFQGCTALSQVNVPKRLKELGAYAFQNSAITSFDLPRDILTVEKNVFYGCPGFAGNRSHYVIQNGIMLISGTGEIYQGIFKNRTDFRKVIIEDGIQTIEESAFEGCSSLKEVSFPETLLEIGNKAFRNCSLTDADEWLPDSLVKEGELIFEGCPGFCGNHSHYVLQNGVLRISGTGAIDYGVLIYKNNFTEVYVEEGITAIDEMEFGRNHTLRHMVLPKSLRYIGEDAFFYCTSLTHVECYASALTLDWVEPARDNFVDDPEKGTIFSVATDQLEYYVAKFGDVQNVTFHGDLPGGEEPVSIVRSGQCGKGAFYDLMSDGTLIIEGIGELDGNVFDVREDSTWKCIKNVIVKAGITYLGWGAFYGCEMLQTIKIPHTVGYFSSGVIEGCMALSDVYCYADPDYFTEGDGFAADGLRIHVLAKDLEIWQNHEEVPEQAIFIGDLEPVDEAFDFRKGRCGIYAYYELDEENTLRVTGSGSIADNFFASSWAGNRSKSQEFQFSGDFLAAQKIIIGEGITGLGEKQFCQLKKLTEVILPESLQTMGKETFYACNQLAYFTIPQGMTRIGEGSFIACDNVMEFSCLANPDVLTWNKAPSVLGNPYYDFRTEGSKTICHVPSNYLKRYQEKFTDVYVTFVGDLAPDLQGVTWERTMAKEPTCTEDGNIEYYWGSDGRIYENVEGIVREDQNGDGIVDLLDVVIPAKGHSHNGADSLIWCWDKTGEGFAVTACLKCLDCGALEESVSASVEKTEGAAGVTYVATATLDGTQVSMTREIKNEYHVTIDGTPSTHAFGDRVTAWAATPSDGMAFAGWYEGDTLVCNSLEIDFLVSRNIALHAVYVDAAQYVEPLEPILNFDLSERVFDEAGNQKLDMTVTWALLEGMSVKDVGLVRTTDAEAELSIDNEEVKKRSAGVDNTSGTFIHHLTLGEISGALTAYAKAYLVYDDAQGEEHVLYTERQSSAPAVRADEAATPLTEGTRSDVPTEAAESADDNAPAAEAESSDDNAPAAEAEDADDNAPAEET